MEAPLYSYLITFLTGLLGIWKAVPVGFALGLNPLVVWFMTVAGASLAALILYFFGNTIRNFLERRRKKPRKEKKQARARKLFDQYGEAGLGILGTLLMGPNMTMLIGLILVNKPTKLLFYTLLGIGIWTFALTLLAVLSIDLFHTITGSSGS